MTVIFKTHMSRSSDYGNLLLKALKASMCSKDIMGFNRIIMTYIDTGSFKAETRFWSLFHSIHFMQQ